MWKARAAKIARGVYTPTLPAIAGWILSGMAYPYWSKREPPTNPTTSLESISE
ncbi:hypothetical protein ABVK25_002629 [Lepraria finkii]|uniref:Uncharacterized protein n=1 Tax=Lepraria finkii TaxID=1340010 RepID=A0ABR4BGN4_9LECA